MNLQELQAVIDTCEFDRWLGLRAVRLDGETVTIHMPMRPEILGTPKLNRLHGGVVGTLIDSTACYLLIALSGNRVSTVDLLVDYLRPAHGALEATARVVKLGRTVSRVSVEVTDAGGKLVATGRLSVAPSDIPIGQEEAFARRPSAAG